MMRNNQAAGPATVIMFRLSRLAPKPLTQRIMDENEKSMFDAFADMKAAYEKFVAEAEAFVKEQKERRMNLPPTLGTIKPQDNG